MRESTRILCVFSACLHLALTGVANAGHVDFLPGYGRSAERIASHECGTHEVHKALETGHQCLLCHRTAGPAAFLATLSVEIPNTSSRIGIHCSPGYSTSVFYNSSLQRGPPIG
ncbi:MAG: hypothetical protein HYW57_07905 [Ignavibacteriales bacterium]|nr:hypothetical protein [Ignavibacteriales bacterium]